MKAIDINRIQREFNEKADIKTGIPLPKNPLHKRCPQQ